jgi:uncharacterized glyoxalase superfamily protein PhnB
MRYRDAAAAIEWLGRAFGFAKHLVVEGQGGSITHAQLTCGKAMIMLASARDDEFGKYQKPPGETGGVCTQSAYLVVADADAHHTRAVVWGARVVHPLQDESYGGRGYSCLDLEGHLWSFGTYNPWV